LENIEYVGKITDFKIHGVKGSATYTYAKEQDITFVEITELKNNT